MAGALSQHRRNLEFLFVLMKNFAMVESEIRGRLAFYIPLRQKHPAASL